MADVGVDVTGEEGMLQQGFEFKKLDSIGQTKTDTVAGGGGVMLLALRRN